MRDTSEEYRKLIRGDINTVPMEEVEQENEQGSYDMPQVMFFGEIYRGGVWLKVTTPCKTTKEAVKETRKWIVLNPR